MLSLILPTAVTSAGLWRTGTLWLLAYLQDPQALFPQTCRLFLGWKTIWRGVTWHSYSVFASLFPFLRRSPRIWTQKGSHPLSWVPERGIAAPDLRSLQISQEFYLLFYTQTVKSPGWWIAVSNSTALPLLQKPNFRLSLHAVESLSSHVLGSSPFAVQQAVPACPMSSQTGWEWYHTLKTPDAMLTRSSARFTWGEHRIIELFRLEKISKVQLLTINMWYSCTLQARLHVYSPFSRPLCPAIRPWPSQRP